MPLVKRPRSSRPELLPLPAPPLLVASLLVALFWLDWAWLMCSWHVAIMASLFKKM